MATCRDTGIYVIGVREMPIAKDLTRLDFHTTRGDFQALFHARPALHKGVIMLGGYEGGFDGPGSVYSDLSEMLLDVGVASLRMDYRIPGDCVQCGVDTLLALQYLDDDAFHDVVLLGWSFGGAVAIAAGSLATTIRGVAAISTVEISDCCARRLRSKPLLLIHGESDLTAPVAWPRRVHSRAEGPHDLILYSGVGHDMQEVSDRLVRDLADWILRTLSSL
ncbi:MAG: alpha/beta hydrolase family protein [Armatimonadota bacterium]